jgi:hypothetical protein
MPVKSKAHRARARNLFPYFKCSAAPKITNSGIVKAPDTSQMPLTAPGGHSDTHESDGKKHVVMPRWCPAPSDETVSFLYSSPFTWTHSGAFSYANQSKRFISAYARRRFGQTKNITATKFYLLPWLLQSGAPTLTFRWTFNLESWLCLVNLTFFFSIPNIWPGLALTKLIT